MTTFATMIGVLIIIAVFNAMCTVLFYRWVIPYSPRKIIYHDDPPLGMVLILAPFFLIGGLIVRVVRWVMSTNIKDNSFTSFLERQNARVWGEDL